MRNNRIAAYALLALLYVGAALAAIKLWVMIGVAGPAAATILPDYSLRVAIYFGVLVVCIAGAAIVHAVLAKGSKSSERAKASA